MVYAMMSKHKEKYHVMAKKADLNKQMKINIGLTAYNAWARAKHFVCHSVITLA